MKLASFSVTNFRSITSAHRIALSGTTVLVGKNNEGKSNLLRALDVAMSVLKDHAGDRTVLGSRLRRGRHYDWQRDFPIQHQSRKTGLHTIFKVEFLLDEHEVAQFKQEIGSNLNGLLPLEIRIGRDNLPVIKVVKQGPNPLSSKSSKIASFVASCIHFNYIPAVRTDDASVELITDLLSQELRALESDADYQAALETISNLQKPILSSLASKLQSPLQEFLPSISAVRIEIQESNRMFALRRNIEVIVDDGTPTSIAYKGDGVKSLAALGLLKYRHTYTGASVLAIEEPEAHLHPGAIHQVNDIIRSIAETNQVIVTTHNPLFVDRENLKANIIVEKGSAKPAKDISSIRDVLGVKASDNLTNANYVLIVEGAEDAIALRALLPHLSEKIGKAFRSNLLVLDPIGGAGKLSYKLALLKNSLCATHCFLDGDDAGRKAYQKAIDEGLTDIRSCTFVAIQGASSAEFEDCLDAAVYADDFLEKFGVDLSTVRYSGKNKWSKRMELAFVAQGKPFDEKILNRAKSVVAQAVSRSPRNALHADRRSVIDALVASLERMIRI